MKILKLIGATLLAGLLVTACGGGNTLTAPTSGSSGTTGTTASVTKLAVTSSTSSIAADGSTTATISAVATDVNNNVVSGATVAFTATAGGIAVTSATTDSTGTATASLTANGAAVGTAITVTATAGSGTGTTVVNVVALTQTVSLITSAAQIPSNSTQSATITALVRDANNNVLPGVKVTFGATSGAIAPSATVAGAAANPAVVAGTTDANGVAQAQLNSGNDFTNRTITVSAAAGSANATVPVEVTGTTLSISGPANLVLNSQATYTVTLKDSGGAGIPNQTVTLTDANGNGLSATSATTGSTGQATVTLTASSSANSGNDTLQAVSLGLTVSQSISVSTQSFAITTPATQTTDVDLGASQMITATWLNNGAPVVGSTVNFSTTRGTLTAASAVTSGSGTASVSISSTGAGPAVVQASGTGVAATTAIDFVATNPTQIAVQATPASVATGASSSITATVRDPNNNLVQGQTVDFVLTDTTGGSLSAPSATTNEQGQATVNYTAGSSTSAANGVSIKGTVAGTAVSNTATLTVGGQTVNLSLGTGNKIVGINQETQYQIEYAIQAIDAHGAAIPNVPVTVSILPVSYIKAYMTWCGAVYGTGCPDPNSHTVPPANTPVTVCPNEDINHTGIYQASEDINNNGKLDPGNVATVSPSSGVTDATGTVIVTITYPADHAFYVTETLTATATVSGTQSSTSATFLLEGATADYDVQTNSPPGPVSPYGIATSCANPN